MNKTNSTLATILLFLGFFLNSCTTAEDPVINSDIKTAGTMNLSVTTSTYNGKYTPKHVLAIWVESNTGTFVKTLLVKAQARKNYLTNWLSSSSGNSVDAITGATLSSHATRTCTWDGTDVNGNVVGDGAYRVCMEFTENDGTGKYSYSSFNKGTVSDSQTPSDKSNFSNISIVWTPAN